MKLTEKNPIILSKSGMSDTKASTIPIIKMTICMESGIVIVSISINVMTMRAPRNRDIRIVSTVYLNFNAHNTNRIPVRNSTKA
jgi:hypothetical protein